MFRAPLLVVLTIVVWCGTIVSISAYSDVDKQRGSHFEKPRTRAAWIRDLVQNHDFGFLQKQASGDNPLTFASGKLPDHHSDAVHFLSSNDKIHRSNRERGRHKKRKTHVAKKKQLSDYIEGLMSCYQILGLGVAIVHKNETVFMEGFGRRSVNPDQPVGPSTLFGIGSTTKAFTTTLLALLQQDGLVDFDAPITEYLPGFGMEDAYATEHMRLRDLVSHRTGMSRNDFWFYSYPPVPRSEYFSHVRNFRMNLEFRESYQYNNIMYAIAGDLVPAVLKRATNVSTSWEEQIAEQIFGPIGMETATTSVDEALASGDFSLPYNVFEYDEHGNPIYIPMPRDSNKIVELVGPAGSVIASAKDMSHWMRFLLNKGEVAGRQILSSELIDELFASVVVGDDDFPVKMSKPTFPVGMQGTEYALGWVRGSYRERTMISHSGGVPDGVTLLSLFPDEELGIFVSGHGGQANVELVMMSEYLITMMATDIYLEDEPWLDLPNSCNFPCSWLPCDSQEQARTTTSSTAFSWSPSNETSPLAYIGDYHDAGWGTFSVYLAASEASLMIKFNRIEGHLVDVGLGDLVLGLLPTGYFEELFGANLIGVVQFERDSQYGQMTQLTVLEWDPDIPPVFKRSTCNH